jgi:hypothetical protein
MTVLAVAERDFSKVLAKYRGRRVVKILALEHIYSALSSTLQNHE